MDFVPFDYSLLSDADNEADRLHSSVGMILDFTFKNSIAALIYNAKLRKAGKLEQDQGIDLDQLESLLYLHAGNENEQIKELMQATYDLWWEQTIMKLAESGLVRFLDNETLVANVNLDDVDNLSPLHEIDHHVTLDGIEYPVLTAISPERMIEYAENPSLFQESFPGGSLEKVALTAKHLRQGLVSVEENQGNYFYYVNRTESK